MRGLNCVAYTPNFRGFGTLVVAELRNNTDIETTVKAFRDLLQRPGMMAPTGVQSHSLHRIHSKLIYDQSRSAIQGDISFGDIFVSPSRQGFYYLVLTPECELEPRTYNDGSRGPKVDLVLVVTGTPGNPPEAQDDTLACTPLFIDSQHAPATWIRWDMRKPSYLPWRRLSIDSRRFKKWGRLRTAEAEQIQLQFASDLLAVGTEDVSGGVYLRPVILWNVTDKRTSEKIADLEITEMAVAGEPSQPQWALAPGCEHELCNAVRAIAPARLVAALRQYMSKTEFRTKLKEIRVGIDEDKQTIHLGWFSTAGYRDQNWKAPRPVPVVPPVDLVKPADSASHLDAPGPTAGTESTGNGS